MVYITGKFLQQGKYKLADGSRYFRPDDFYIGGRVEINKFKFVILDADEYALHWMEKHDVSLTRLCAYSLYLSFTPSYREQ
jgi:hypothetical protein